MDTYSLVDYGEQVGLVSEAPGVGNGYCESVLVVVVIVVVVIIVVIVVVVVIVIGVDHTEMNE